MSLFRQLTIRLEPAHFRTLETIVKQRDSTFTEVIRDALDQYSTKFNKEVNRNAPGPKTITN